MKKNVIKNQRLTFQEAFFMLGFSDYSSFWSSFWAGLFSGLIYSVITGVIVGLVVWWVQLKVEKRRERNGYERELMILRSKIKRSFEVENIFDLNDLKTLPTVSIEIFKHVYELPLDLYFKYCPDNRVYVENLKSFIDDFQTAEVKARKLDANVKQWLRKYNSERNSISSNDSIAYVCYSGRLLNFEDSEIAPYLDIPINYIPEWVDQCYLKIKEDEMINNLSKDYLKSKAQLENRIEEIKKLN